MTGRRPVHWPQHVGDLTARPAPTAYLCVSMATGTRPTPTRAATVPHVHAAPPQRAPAPISGGASAPSPADTPDPGRIGVVLVHGIGTQPACETFLDWGGSIVRVLSDWRGEHTFGPDPVVRCDYDLSGARLPILELDVPEYEGHPAQKWVVTEAWWAARTRAPSLGYMTTYVFHALRRIMAGIRNSYRVRRELWAKRRGDTIDYARNSAGYQHSALVLGTVGSHRSDWIDVLDWIQKELTILAFGPALILGQVALAAYAPFRAIPIATLQNAAALKSVDNFLTRWFGELPDISRDPVQSANVRTSLAAAVRGLRKEGCGRMVVVAHSGGAIVSFETLCDGAFSDIEVDKLITLGEGLALAWRIEDAYKGLPVGSRLLGDLTALRPELLWADFWSSYDPAPAGQIVEPPGVHLSDRPYPTINRMSLLEDHGSYWDNDEEFMIPLLQNIDVPDGRSEQSRFFRDDHLGTVRATWRRRRVGILALWRWIATLGAVVPIAATTFTSLFGAAGVAACAPLHGPERLGAAFASWWATIPGHEIIARPLDGLSKVAGWPGFMPRIGEWAGGTTIIAVAFLVLARIGVGRWEAWDLSERVAARKRVPEQEPGWWHVPAAILFPAASVGMALATFAILWR